LLSNQILQNTIDGLKGITRREISVIGCDGTVICATENETINTYVKVEGLLDFINSEAAFRPIQGYQYHKAFDNNVTEYIIGVKGDDAEALILGRLAAFQIQSLIAAYKERFDRDNFIKSLLLDNMLSADIYSRAKKLHIENDARRVVYLIKTRADDDIDAAEIIRGIFPQKAKDFIAATDNDSIVLVKELRERDERCDIERIADIISDTIAAEAMSKVYISIGTPIADLKHVSVSYRQAKTALEVGNIFEPEKSIINYDNLGIGRLLYHLPPDICKTFVTEVLQNLTLDSFDDETINTVNKFFENNLNVSEASRKLFIHRNTLVYRLDKLQKTTGLDLRKFEDAIVFKMTIMVSRYLDAKNGEL